MAIEEKGFLTFGVKELEQLGLPFPCHVKDADGNFIDLCISHIVIETGDVFFYPKNEDGSYVTHRIIRHGDTETELTVKIEKRNFPAPLSIITATGEDVTQNVMKEGWKYQYGN